MAIAEHCPTANRLKGESLVITSNVLVTNQTVPKDARIIGSPAYQAQQAQIFSRSAQSKSHLALSFSLFESELRGAYW